MTLETLMYTGASIIIAGLFFYDNVAQFLRDKFLTPTAPTAPTVIDKHVIVSTNAIGTVEQNDQEAIARLRNRAVEMGHQELIDLLKQINSLFYDIHASIAVKE